MCSLTGRRLCRYWWQRWHQAAAAMVALMLGGNAAAAVAREIVDAAYAISFSVPTDFQPLEVKPPTLYAFCKGDPQQPQLNLILAIERTGGLMPRQQLTVPAFTDSRQIEPFAYEWQGIELQGFYVYESVLGLEIVHCNIALPLAPEALLVKASGLRSRRQEVRQTVEMVLASLRGQIAWAEPPPPPARFFTGVRELLVFLLGVFILMLSLSRWLLHKPDSKPLHGTGRGRQKSAGEKKQ